MATAHTPELNDLFAIGQIRLRELSVFNWGSFNGLHTAAIDAEGTLVTGDNGAGKSTFIDGLMALLLPAGRATFNVAAAQGDKSDRSLLSYMRGSFGSAHDGANTRVKSKRENAVVSGLRALYLADDGSEITLAALFFTTQSSNALKDVTKIYAVANKNITLKEILDAFGDGNARALKKWLRDDPAITCCDDRFADYQELYRKRLYMDNKNAPALLSRALGLKKIDDLTGLIRELVLEPSTVRDDARKVVAEFTDLVAIHTELADARARRDHLSKLPDLDTYIKKATKKITGLQRERDGLPVYMGEICHGLWSDKIDALDEQKRDLALLIKQAKAEETDADRLAEGRHEDYIKAGGGRIEVLKDKLGHATHELDRVKIHASRYQEDTRSLALNNVLSESVFIHNQTVVADKLDRIEDDKKDVQNRFADIAGKNADLHKLQTSISNDITDIEARPDSNIDIQYQRLRDEMLNALALEREQCVFMGELIDVRDEQQHWQGAIERALGGLRTTLAVPETYFSLVTRWLNSRHTGLHVRVQVVRDADSNQTANFKDKGFLRKLVWREHPYREWLKRHLARFDLICVSSTDELDKTPFSITEQGLIHFDKGRFEKKDQHKIDDRRRWYLGFSNQSRLALLRNELSTINHALADTTNSLKHARAALDAVNAHEALCKKLLDYQWGEINTPYWQSRTETLQAELQLLEQASDDLNDAKTHWDSAKQALATIRDTIADYLKQDGGLDAQLSDAKSNQAEAARMAAAGVDDVTRELLAKRIDHLALDDLDNVATLLNQYGKAIEQALEEWRNKTQRAERAAIGIMAGFRSHEKWQVIAADWRADISNIDEYILHFRALEDEGLPLLVEQFVQRLNKHATQSLARIKQRLDSERDDILERIETINRVLRRTEFRAGSYLKLGAKSEKYPHVVDFNQQVNKVLNQATSDDHELRFKQLALVVEILNKASSSATATSLESQRLLDPRHQMSFYAEELDIVSGEVRDVLESSSGKSGGEKESFAGTIVAASLAYVLTPDSHDRPVYSTVFLDEAFSNTAEAVSRRVLRVFKALHIHVNLITPYKNLNLARESARSLLIAERDPENHSSHLCEVTWQEIDRQLAEQRERTLTQETSLYGVTLEDNNGR